MLVKNINHSFVDSLDYKGRITTRRYYISYQFYSLHDFCEFLKRFVAYSPIYNRLTDRRILFFYYKNFGTLVDSERIYLDQIDINYENMSVSYESQHLSHCGIFSSVSIKRL